MIKCRDLTVNYTAAYRQIIPALKNFSLDINEAEFITIIGSNGSGKSTLALCLAGLYTPNSGSIEIDGYDMKDLIKSGEIRNSVGIVFQNPDNQLLTNFLDREIALTLENRGIPREEMQRIVEQALVHFNLHELRKLQPNQLSGGQKQKLALASIMVGQPKYLILDETTSYLDPVERKTILSLLKSKFEQRKNSGFSIVLITQFVREAVDCDRVIVMNNGSIAAEGPPSRVFGECSSLLDSIGIEIPIEYRLQKVAPDLEISSELFSRFSR